MSTGLKTNEGRVSAWTLAPTLLYTSWGVCTSSSPFPALAYRVEVGALVLGPIAGVAEGLLTAWVLAQVRLLARVAPQVDLEVLQSREGLAAAFKLWERLVRGGLQPPEVPSPSPEMALSILCPPPPARPHSLRFPGTLVQLPMKSLGPRLYLGSPGRSRKSVPLT